MTEAPSPENPYFFVVWNFLIVIYLYCGAFYLVLIHTDFITEIVNICFYI
jgi:hypothetical protein